jgi:hypothetical protein
MFTYSRHLKIKKPSFDKLRAAFCFDRLQLSSEVYSGSQLTKESFAVFQTRRESSVINTSFNIEPGAGSK